jgi:hypothetical protein
VVEKDKMEKPGGEGFNVLSGIQIMVVGYIIVKSLKEKAFATTQASPAGITLPSG